MKSFFIYPDSSTESGLKFARDCALTIKEDITVKILEYVGSKVTNKKLRSALKKNPAENFLAFGHGNDTQFTIGENEISVFSIDDTDLLSNKVCYFLACCTGKKLGPRAIEQGAIAFFGFKENFTFTPKYSEDFIECCTSGIRDFLLKKCTINEIEKITRKSFEDKSKHFLSINANQAAKWCDYNINSMVFLLHK